MLNISKISRKYFIALYVITCWMSDFNVYRFICLMCAVDTGKGDHRAVCNVIGTLCSNCVQGTEWRVLCVQATWTDTSQVG